MACRDKASINNDAQQPNLTQYHGPMQTAPARREQMPIDKRKSLGDSLPADVALFGCGESPYLSVSLRDFEAKVRDSPTKRIGGFMDIIALLISLISGAVGGNIAGAVLKDQSLGTLGNSIAGILGGGIGGAILQSVLGVPAGGGGLDLGSLIGNIASGGVGGGILMAIIGLIKGAMARA